MRTGARFTAEQSGDAVIIRLHRHALDSRFSRRDRRALETLLSTHPRLILDLNAVATINGTGLEMVADWTSYADSAGNSLVLVQCSRQVMSLMNILGASQVARVAPSVSDAIHYFDTIRPKKNIA
jgi:anti-anti-sigma factor